MRRTRWSLPIAIVLGLALFGVAAADRDSDVPLTEVPDEVKRAAKKAVPGIRLLKAEINRSGPQLKYELTGSLSGAQYEIEVTEDGELLEVKQKGGAEIQPSELPEVVQEAVRDALPGAELVAAQIVRRKQGHVYEIEALLDGRGYDIVVQPDGKLLEVEEQQED